MEMNAFDTSMIEEIRAQFPALNDTTERTQPIYFDNPAGTQVPRQVIDAVAAYYGRHNANYGGQFRTSRETGEMTERVREKMATFVGAVSSREIMFGASMTSITFQMADMIGELMRPGDEIVLTRMDHDGNVTPWLRMAEKRGVEIRWLPFDTATAQFDLAHLDDIVSDRTRFGAINYASNITGTINDVERIVKRLKAAGAMTYLDAVQYAPHGVIDVTSLGCDFFVCSAYKFYGPHLGVLWANPGAMDRLTPLRLQAAPSAWPQAFERGCLNSEGIAGLGGALDYYAFVAAQVGASGPDAYDVAKRLMHQHEAMLTTRLIDGLSTIQGIDILGITDPAEFDKRVSTVSVSVPGHDPAALAKYLGDHEIYVWNGHNYALTVIESYGLGEFGGVLRFGPVHYNTPAEVDRTLEVLAEAVTSGVAVRK